MTVQYPTLDSITKVMVEALAGPGKTLQDLPDQWLAKSLIIAARNAAYAPVVAAKGVYQANDLFQAVDNDLDRLCEERSATVRRKQEKKAVVRYKLKRTLPASANKTIPSGSLITTQAAGDNAAVDFLVMKENEGEENEADPVFLAGTTELIVMARCSKGGVIGNLTTNSVVYSGMVWVDKVEVLALIEEGTDTEDNEVLRARLLEEVRNIEKGGTATDYEIWAKRVTGVVSARCMPLVRGNGTVDVIITGSSGIPTTELITEVQGYIDTKTPAGGANVLVKGPTPVMINVTATVKLLSEFTFTLIKPKIVDALTVAIDKENGALMVRLNKLVGAINGIEGVFNFTITSPALDIVIDGDELAIPGIFSLTEVT
ncbi:MULTISPECIES: baseplate J/gp47 family protein [unclassified Paenibacillus]|uniref:baseplate J/gp47 family protein n=1 Tax=unclassified Paenibacillus TaxID=185978 RepID=UPI0036375995